MTDCRLASTVFDKCKYNIENRTISPLSSSSTGAPSSTACFVFHKQRALRKVKGNESRVLRVEEVQKTHSRCLNLGPADLNATRPPRHGRAVSRVNQHFCITPAPTPTSSLGCLT